MQNLYICVIVLFILGAIFAIEPIYAATYTGVLDLEPVNSKIQTGSTVIFEGTLGTTSGHVVTDALVEIKDDVDFGRDKVIAQGYTDDNGRFRLAWTAQPRSSGAWDFYAIYDGSSDISKSRSTSYSVRVSSSYSSGSSSSFVDPSTQISFTRLPSSVYEGDYVTFSGTLTTSDGQGLAGKTIYIKEDDPGPDETLTYTTTDYRGTFSVQWFVRSGLVETQFDIYAIFEGDSSYDQIRSYNQEMYVFESRGATVTLYDITSSVYVGQSVTFNGKLESGGQGLAGKTIIIKDDDPGRDDTLAIITTDSYGQFSVSWIAEERDVDSTLDIFAVFEGDSSYGRSTSKPTKSLTINKYGGSITLDRIPSSANVGDMLIFTGTLNLDVDLTGAIVYIKDEDTGGFDDLLATGYVNSYGEFSANWFVTKVDPSLTSNAEIFAVFEGNSFYERLYTHHQSLNIVLSPSTSPPPYTPPPSTSPPTTINQIKDTDTYMELYYSLDFTRSPHVAIIPTPDSYDAVKGHIIPTQEGVLMWKSYLESAYGGDWNITFEIAPKGATRLQYTPDVIINLITPDDNDGCIDQWYGVATIHESPFKPVNAKVCSIYGKSTRSNVDVSATAAHEFIHAVGLGHTFNKRGDMMCSVEDDKRTCEDLNSKSKTPSNLNLAAVTSIYGTDGFKNPNRSVVYEERFALATQNQQTQGQSPVTIGTEGSNTQTDPTFNSQVRVYLDQNTYTWNDNVYITIDSPDHNFDSYGIDTLGNSQYSTIKAYTADYSIDGVMLVETGSNTGIFTGEILIPELVKSINYNGLEQNSKNQFTISFEYSNKKVTKSSSIQSNVGTIRWIDTSYYVNDIGLVRVTDPDVNYNSNQIDSFTIQVWSTTDSTGIDVIVTETGTSTGIFEGTVFFDNSYNSLKISGGDTVTARYVDDTISGTGQWKSVLATATIYDDSPQLDSEYSYTEPISPEPKFGDEANYFPESTFVNASCGPGTELIDGICHAQQTSKPQDRNPMSIIIDFFNSLIGYFYNPPT